MAKLSSIQKNLKRKLLVNKFRDKKFSLKKKVKNKELSLDERIKLYSKINELQRNASKVRVRNRCIITGRSRGVYRKFGLSRIKIREISMAGMLPGVVKSSW